MNKKSFIYIILTGFITGLLISHFFYINPTFFKQNTTYGNDIDINNLLQQAKEAYYNGNFKHSANLYKQIMQYDDSNIEAKKNLIIIYKDLGYMDKAVKLYQELINKYPDNLLLQYKLGLTYYQAGQYENGLQILLNVYHIIEDFEKEILSSDEYELFNYYLGKCFQLTGDFENALKHYNKGINLNKTFTLNYIGKAEIYSELGKYEKANSAYEKALSYDSSLSIIYPELASNYEKLNQPHRAYYYWNKSLETGNKTTLARQKIEKLEEKYPEYKEEDEEIKDKVRADINWIQVKPITEVETIPELRIGLLRKITHITLQTGSPFIIKNSNNGKVLLEGEAKTAWEIKYNNQQFSLFKKEELVQKIDADGPLILELKDRSATFVLYNVSYGRGYFWAGTEDRQYRGQIELLPVDKNKFNVVNIIDLESYLLSVVPAEMPAWWPKEALKAQAIAARSYALNNRNRHQHEGFDLCATVHCAVYKGVKSEHPRSTAAVKATRAEVATYNDKIINAVFSSNSGGYSESSNDVWSSSVPYLSGANNMLDKNFKFPLEPYKLKQWLRESPSSYSNNKFTGTNIYRWNKVISVDYFKEKYRLEKIDNIIPLERSIGGSINSIKITGDNKEINIKKDSIRSALGGLRSNRFYIEKIYDKDNQLKNIIIHGSGWGHNVGLDQTAAAGMVEYGYNYQDIIKHFYPGTDIKKWY